MSKLLEYYKLLGVTAGAGLVDITASYRRLCRIYHPDVSSDPESEELMKRINVAYTALRDKFRTDMALRERIKKNGARTVRRYPAPDARTATGMRESVEAGARRALDGYFKALVKCDYDAAYDFLSEYDKRHITREDFIVWRKSVARLYPMRGYVIMQGSAGAEVSFNDGVRLKARKLRVEITEADSESERLKTGGVKKLVICENGSWRVFLGYKDIKEFVRDFDARFEEGRYRAAAKQWEEYYSGLCPEFEMLSLKGFRKAALRETYRQNRYGGVLTFAVFAVKPAPDAPEGAAEGVLLPAAKTLKAALRETDTPVYAGDGIFAALFVELRKKHARAIITRIAEAMKNNTSALPGGPVSVETVYETLGGGTSAARINILLGKFNKKL